MSITVNEKTIETDMGNVCINPCGTYDDARSYAYLDTVDFEGGSYMCTAPIDVTDKGVLIETMITGVPPEPGKTTEYWQVLTIPGNLTPEYIAMHDRVENNAQQTEFDRAAVELSEQNVSSMETNVEQMQADVQAGAAQVAKDKDSAAGYAQAAEVSRQAAAESEANVNAQVTGFDSHVQEKTTDATGTIETARQQAVSVVQQQGAESTQGVIDDTEAYFEEKKTAALSEISDKTSEVVKAVTDEGTKQIGLVDAAGAAQVAAVEQEGTDQIASIQMEAESYIRREDANKLAFKGQESGRNIHVEDSAEWGFLGMHGYGESAQVQTTGAQLQSFVDNTVNNYGITFTVDGETISLKGTSTFSGGRSNFTLPATTLPAGTYALSLSESINAVLVVTNTADNSAIKSTQKAVNFTLAEETNISLGFNVESGGTYNISKLRIMLNTGDTALPWEPYTGGAPSPSTAYPQEIESKCQVQQLLDESTLVQGMIHGVTGNNDGSSKFVSTDFIPVTPGDYIISGINITPHFNVVVPYDANKNILPDQTISVPRATGIFTVPEGVAYIRIRFNSATGITDPITPDELRSKKPMLNAGTIPGAWAPYGKYGLEYTVRTGQLVDYVNSYDTEYNGIKMKIDRETGVVTFTGSNTAASAVIYHLELTRTVKAGETVYLNAGNNIVNSNVSLRMYNKDTLVGVITDLTAPNKKASYTVPSDCNRLTVRFAQGATANITLRPMLAVNDQDWQPCAAQTLRVALDTPLRGTPVSSGGNMTIGGKEYIADYRDWERGKHVQMVTEETFDGSTDEAIANNAGSSGMGGRFSLKSKTVIKAGCGFCNMAEISNYGDSKGKFGTGNYGGTSTMYYIGYSDDEMTVEEFRTLLSANPLVFCVPLATPIETDITPEELAAYRRLHAYHGTTNIHNSDDVYTAVEYARDPDTYLNNKLAEISAAIIGG